MCKNNKLFLTQNYIVHKITTLTKVGIKMCAIIVKVGRKMCGFVEKVGRKMCVWITIKTVPIV